MLRVCMKLHSFFPDFQAFKHPRTLLCSLDKHLGDSLDYAYALTTRTSLTRSHGWQLDSRRLQGMSSVVASA